MTMMTERIGVRALGTACTPNASGKSQPAASPRGLNVYAIAWCASTLARV